jgi:hypothetical protein
MKNLFFSLLAMSLLSTTAFAGEGKTVRKEHHKTTCPANCSRKGCPKTADCPVPGCVCK